MKRGTSNHPKVYELAAALKIKRPLALGYLQLLWDFAADYAPEGDVGRYSDSRIEAALDWGGARGKLVAALVHSRWLDPTEERRLVVHDWLDHAEKSVHRKLQRAALRNQADTKKVTHQSGVTDAVLDTPVREGAPPAFAFNRSPSQSPPTLDSLAEKLYSRHPNRAGRILFEQALAQALSAAVDPDATATRIESAHAAWLPNWERDGGRYAPRLDRWIQSGGFLDDPPAGGAPDNEYRPAEEFRREELV
jgi:hypothetical protein